MSVDLTYFHHFVTLDFAKSVTTTAKYQLGQVLDEAFSFVELATSDDYIILAFVGSNRFRI